MLYVMAGLYPGHLFCVASYRASRVTTSAR